ncbi:hypothetical protein AXW84_15435 [Hymenobacter sp. PAMC 26628]|nr:hypothetical protein AXW84_15435 [Hymenobacter sp. PAMC 26628]
MLQGFEQYLLLDFLGRIQLPLGPQGKAKHSLAVQSGTVKLQKQGPRPAHLGARVGALNDNCWLYLAAASSKV